MLEFALIAYAVASAATFLAYGWDKRQAMRGGRRARERTLHLLELAGGWPGGLVGQIVFKHKRQKVSYMLVFAGIVLLHVAGWYVVYRYWISP